MFFLEAQKSVEASEHAEEIQSGKPEIQGVMGTRTGRAKASATGPDACQLQKIWHLSCSLHGMACRGEGALDTCTLPVVLSIISPGLDDWGCLYCRPSGGAGLTFGFPPAQGQV